MKVLGKLIFSQVIKSSLFVLLALVALFAFFDLIGQSSKIGTTYTIGQAFMLTALVLPMRSSYCRYAGSDLYAFKIGCYQPVYGDESLGR